VLLLHLVLQKCVAVNTGMPASAEAENVTGILILALALDRREFLAHFNGVTHSIFYYRNPSKEKWTHLRVTSMM